MYQVLRIRNTLVHVPSVASIYLRKSIMGRPLLTIQQHNGWSNDIKYGWTMWHSALSDYQTIQRSMLTCQEALKSVPWMESVQHRKAASIPSS